MIGARADEIAVTTGASAGLASVAAGIDWKPGDEVLVGRGEFPAHFSTWLRYQKAGKLRVRIITPKGRFITADDYIDQIGPRTRVVSASLVRFDNGARLDARRVRQVLREIRRRAASRYFSVRGSYEAGYSRTGRGHGGLQRI